MNETFMYFLNKIENCVKNFRLNKLMKDNNQSL